MITDTTDKNYKIIIRLVIFLIVITIISLGLILIERMEPYTGIENPKSNKTDKDKKIDYKYENIVFIGDSITDFYNVNTFYPDLPVVNSGHSGNSVGGVYGNLEDDLYKYNPTKVFLLIGTNNLTGSSSDEIVYGILKIAREIHKNRPNAKLYIESIYPVNNKTDNDVVIDWMVGKRENKKIMEINKELEINAKAYNYEYIDMYDELTDSDGNLNLEYTIDGLHLSPEGYKVVTAKRMKYIVQPSKWKNIDKNAILMYNIDVWNITRNEVELWRKT